MTTATAAPPDKKVKGKGAHYLVPFTFEKYQNMSPDKTERHFSSERTCRKSLTKILTVCPACGNDIQPQKRKK